MPARFIQILKEEEIEEDSKEKENKYPYHVLVGKNGNKGTAKEYIKFDSSLTLGAFETIEEASEHALIYKKVLGFKILPMRSIRSNNDSRKVSLENNLKEKIF
jgi:hypothetical protein